MKFRSAFILLAAFPLALSAAETPAPVAPKPSVMQRLLHPFGGGAAPAAPTPAPVPAEVKESAPKSPKKQSGSASSAVKQAATPAPATPKPSMIDRLLHPFSEPATTEPPAPATPAPTKSAGTKTSKKGAVAATPAPAEPRPGMMQRLLHPFGEPAAPEPPSAPATPAPTKDAGTKTAKKDAAAATPAPATPKPGMMQRLMHPFGGAAAPGAPAAKDASLKGLEMGASVEPPAPQLSETREVRVTVTLANKGKKLAQLAFPTNQRIEVLVKDKGGKNLVQWSEDQAFFAEPTLITINPGERLEYAATVSTRDLVAGETYTVEAFFPSFPELRRTLGLAPEK